MSSEQPGSSLKELLANNRGLAVVAGLLLLGFAIMLVLVLVLLLGDGRLAADPTPTPFADDSALTAGGEPLVVGVSDTDTISVTLDMPTTLEVGGRAFSIRPQTIAANRIWTPTFDEENTAVWVYGTIINYVLGLPDTAENQALLEQLAPGDRLLLTTRGDVQHLFALNSRERILPGNQAIYAQQTPGLTVILVGSTGEDRLVVNGRYIAEAVNDAGRGQDNVVELGETAQLDDLQITVTGAAYVLDRPEAQTGFAFYLVDYQVQNVGLTALDTSRLGLTLSDESGNQYAVNPAAGQLGNFPVLGGFLNAGQTIQATAGYQIPTGLNSANVHWLVTHSTTGAQLQVMIPFSGGARAAQNAQVTLTEAAVSPDLARLSLNGQITNLGDQPLVVAETDLSLRTDDGSAYLMLSTNPAFPWTVAPGQSVPYSVTFQRPATADNAIFTVFNQPFQLSNLR